MNKTVFLAIAILFFTVVACTSDYADMPVSSNSRSIDSLSTVWMNLFEPNKITAITENIRSAPSNSDITLTVDKATVLEGESAQITATLPAVSEQTVTLMLARSGTARIVADYTLSETRIIIPKGSSSGFVTVRTIDDLLFEGDETVMIQVSRVTGAIHAGELRQTVTIANNDPPPAISLSTRNNRTSEKGGIALITATLSSKSMQPVIVHLCQQGGTADETDYRLTQTVIRIPPNKDHGFVRLIARNDLLNDGDKTVILSACTVNGATNNGQSQTITIVDDDPTPTITLSVNKTAVQERDGSASIQIKANRRSGFDIAVSLILTGSATRGEDYTLTDTALSSGSPIITISKGQTIGSMTVHFINDAIDEENETIVVEIDRIKDNRAVVLGVQKKAIVIQNDDPHPTVSLSVNKGRISKNGDATTIRATLSALSGKNIRVTLTTSGTAAPSEYTLSSRIMTILSGNENSAVTLTAVNNFWPDTTVFIDMTCDGNCVESGSQSVAITLVKDDPVPPVSGAYYIAPYPEGNDQNSGTEFSPYATFTKAFSMITAGDTLIVKDGIYLQSIIPTESGIFGKPITLIAENDGMAIIDGRGMEAAINIQNKSYITIEGFNAQNSGEMSVVEISGHDGPNWDDMTNNIIVRRVFARGSCLKKNCNVFEISRTKDSLFEDIWTAGNGRYSLAIYGSTRITVRRAVVRWDGWNGTEYKPSDPRYNMGVYNTHDSLFENIVLIDKVPFNDPQSDQGGLYLPGNDNGETAPWIDSSNNKFFGAIILNNAGIGIAEDAGYPGTNKNNVFINSVIWGNRYGISVNSNASDTVFNHVTIGKNADGGSWFNPYNDVIGSKIENSLIFSNANNGLNGVIRSDYNNIYQNTEDYLGGAVRGSNDSSHDPGIKYIVQLEDISHGKGTASDGGDRGATVIKRYMNGLLTTTNLWPWPHEERIKIDLCAEVTRGWCGTNQSLTQYIWEYLGNQYH